MSKVRFVFCLFLGCWWMLIVDALYIAVRWKSDDFPNISELFSDADDQLFSLISHNVTHVLKPLLPTQTQHSYNLRDRRHNFVLVEKNSQINHRHFIIRRLYKYSYWLYVWFLVLCLVWGCVLSTFIKRILYCIVLYNRIVLATYDTVWYESLTRTEKLSKQN